MSNSGGVDAKYGVILVRNNIDRFEHNTLFAQELIAAFADFGVGLLLMDYITEPRAVFGALKDKDCGFFICFNGFGSELRFPSSCGGPLLSAFSAFNKQLFDLMHDCPAHESMAHQLGSTCVNRMLLLTDFGYAGVATDMGVPSVNYVPSITFPKTLSMMKPIAGRSIDVLLPISLTPPGLIEDRHSVNGGHKSRLYRSLFFDVSAKVSANWQLDPLSELVSACREVGLVLNWSESDDRFLLTTVLDHVKFVRRQSLVRAIAHLPVTIVTDREVDNVPPNSRVKFVAARPASQLLALMADSRIVVSPSPHMRGFHERSLGALTAGAVLVSSPNRVFEADLMHWRDLVFFQSETDVAGIVELLLSDQQQLETIAESGRTQALQLYPPARLVKTILSLLDLRLGKKAQSMMGAVTT